ncbi:MAG: LytTR family DNA-binding domain-containing protein [Lentimicrobium sp.]|nr:LytTR family DNA-binding domain-containing protein [Lentimicrobium sp.]
MIRNNAGWLINHPVEEKQNFTIIVEKRSLQCKFVSDLFQRNESSSTPAVNYKPCQPEEIMIKAVVIIHDQATLQQTTETLHSMCTRVEVTEVCDSIKTGIAAINALQPDLVILEIQLADGTGFELLNHFQKPDFKIIFISEYAEYAIRAFDYNALGYVLKPIQEQKLIIALNKVMDAIKYEERIQLDHFESELKGLSQVGKVILRTSGEIHSVDISKIIRLNADRSYATFYIDDGRKIIVSRPMKDFEELLLENGFFRPHKSHMINVKKLKYFEKADGGFLVMDDGAKVPVSSRKYDAVIELLESVS